LVQERTIALNQPIAWNPTGKGWKLEDTWLTTSDGVRLCTSDPQWPNREVGGRFRPDLLRR
jgi:antitoxin VapB